MLRQLVERVVVRHIFAEHKTNVHYQQTHAPASINSRQNTYPSVTFTQYKYK